MLTLPTLTDVQNRLHQHSKPALCDVRCRPKNSLAARAREWLSMQQHQLDCCGKAEEIIVMNCAGPPLSQDQAWKEQLAALASPDALERARRQAEQRDAEWLDAPPEPVLYEHDSSDEAGWEEGSLSDEEGEDSEDGTEYAEEIYSLDKGWQLQVLDGPTRAEQRDAAQVRLWALQQLRKNLHGVWAAMWLWWVTVGGWKCWVCAEHAPGFAETAHMQ